MHPNETAIHDYVDEALGPAERVAVEQHLAACPTCRALADDLREIRRAAASLELREPPARAWSRLERAIQFESQHARHAAPRSFAQRLQDALVSPSGRIWLAAAAVLIIATVAGLRFGPLAPRSTPSEAPPAAAAGSDAARAVEAELRQAEEHYEKAIKGLEQIANAEQGALDPRTAATLQKNLSVIDQAISESRAALREEPTSEPAQQSLIDSFKTKMGLLQDTVALINEMRKGNEAGAARIVSGLKPKG
jgi:anti-sigma factor RsiW